MKKIILVVLLLIPLSTKAYENEYFKIDLDNTYNEVVINENTYIWTNKETNDLPNIVVSISNNNPDKLQNIENYSQSDINTYKTTLLNKYNRELSKYNINTEITAIKKKKINNVISLYYETHSNTSDKYGFNIHQYNYTFTTNKYITSITFTNNVENNNLDNIIKTFTIKDNKIETSFFDYKKNKILISLLSIGLFIFIIFKILQKKRKLD